MTGRSPRVPMTPELLSDMVNLLSTAKSFREISRKVGVPLASVRVNLAPFVAIMKTQGVTLPSMAKPHRAPITPAQIADISDRMLTATSLREIARELDLDKQTVFARARPIIADMRAAGTLGLCACGRERFHPRICFVNTTGSHKRWETPEQIEKREAIVAAIMAGETYAEIGRRWGIGQRGALGYAARHLTDEQRALRKSLEQRRERRSAMCEAYRPFRDEVYAKIDAAVPRWLSDATRDDAISDLYVAVLDGTVSLENIAADAKAYANRAIGQYESKFGPRSLDEKLFDDGDMTFGETLVDPAALDAFDYIFEEAR